MQLGKFFLALSLLSSFSLKAASIAILGPCSNEPIIQGEFSAAVEQSVGDVTIAFLTHNSVSFQGTEQGINSIFNSPTGLEAMEVISHNEMYAYGWCYSVNGFEPALFPNQVHVHKGDEVLWWFGYAHFKNGDWISQCVPSYLRIPSQVCPIDEF